jgi:hypothetical protein
MPRGDGTGPRGTGSRSGRGAGGCAGGSRGNAKNLAGKNAAGRGQCGWFNVSDLTAGSGQATEEKLLREEADRLAKQLEVINRRLEELGK